MEEEQVYKIKDCGEGSGTFVKIDSPLTLQNDQIISFGDSHMAIHIKD